jgi:myo-inositol-1(or 4)-monophosphatase
MRNSPRRGRITVFSARKARAGTDRSHRWIVDPLDGTTNFLHGIPHFAVSIALERDGAIVAALTYNPANDDLFIAERGKGAFLNDRRIRVAARQRLAEAVVACGLPHYGAGDLVLGRHEIAAAQSHFAGLRRFGAASLDLAWVAAGRFDAYWERDLSPWDLAAGILLVREAGGFVSDLDRGDAILTKGQIAAGNETMHRELIRLMQAVGKQAAT